jgi:hypothetical protein
MMKLGTEEETKVGLSKYFSSFDLSTLQQQLGQLERSKLGKGKKQIRQVEGLRGKRKLRLSKDICGFSLQILQQQTMF